MSYRVKAVTVNQDTSHFAELMLRTLFYTNDLSGIDLEIVVLDNGSDDEHREQLQTYLTDQGVPLIQTGFDNSVAPQKHGVALTDFVLEDDGCTHYLFLDSDMWFVEEDTIPTMLAELVESPPDVFGCQAQIFGFYAHRIIESGEYEFDSYWHGEVERTFEDARFTLMLANRCSPACSLITNTSVFRRVVEVIGLGRAASFGVGGGAYYDTFGLMTHVMATHGLDFIVSSKRINHFTETTYKPDLRAPKDRDCLKMLRELRAGRGMTLDLFWDSDWDR
jgi:hypothetical protein